MKKIKEEKGITLVALIITIVVLLILAIVGIGAIRDSKIIAHAQNAAGSFNQAKNNEVDALTKYEEEIEKYVPGEKKEYIGNIRLNTEYYSSRKVNHIIGKFLNNGKAEISGSLAAYFGNIVDYTLNENGDEVEMIGRKFKAIRLENNDLLIDETSEAPLLSTTTEGIIYFNGEKYISGEKYIILNEDGTEWSNNFNGGNNGNPPALYNGVVYGVTIDGDGDGTHDILTSLDNANTIVLCGEVYTKVTE